MNPKLQARVAHVVDGKATGQRPIYYDLIKFTVEKEAEINFDEAKKTRDLISKPKAIMHFCFSNKKSMLPTTPAVWMVAPAPSSMSSEAMKAVFNNLTSGAGRRAEQEYNTDSAV